MRPVFRFAPSPNGELHLGHALSAIVGFEAARRSGGRFLLRIEDIDQARTREDYVAAIHEDLAWLGLTWEPDVLRQSAHFDDYRAAAARLDAMGLVYPCFASRTEIAEAAKDRNRGVDPEGVPIYPGLHKDMPADEVSDRKARGEPFAMRLDMDRAVAAARVKLEGRPLTFRETDETGVADTIEAKPETWGDCVVMRKDVPASYLLAATYDDARQSVTHVTRGRDLFAATDVQRLLQVLLDFPEPLYHHHRLLVDASGRKLSKSARDTSIRSLRRAGATPSQIRTMIGLDEIELPVFGVV